MASSDLQVDVICDEEMQTKFYSGQYLPTAADGQLLNETTTISDVWGQVGPPQGHIRILRVIVTRPDVVGSLNKSREWFLSLFLSDLVMTFLLLFSPI